MRVYESGWQSLAREKRGADLGQWSLAEPCVLWEEGTFVASSINIRPRQVSAVL